MPFDYYYRLSPNDQKIYRQSEALADLPAELRRVVRSHDWRGALEGLRQALEAGQRLETERAARDILDQLAFLLGAPKVRVRVRSVRPSEDWGELHGLYTPVEGRAWGVVEVWMRTARHKRVVAFRTFLRTLLHEFCHHLDYELFELEDSFHNEGFFKREVRGAAGKSRGTERGHLRFLMRTGDGIVSGIRCRSRLRVQGPQTPAPKRFGRRGIICFVAHARRMPQYAFARERLTAEPTALRTQPTGLPGRASRLFRHLGIDSGNEETRPNQSDSNQSVPNQTFLPGVRT